MLRHLYQLTKNRIGGSVLPLELIVFITERCPLRCEHCFIEEFQTDPASDLPLSVIERLASDLPNLMVVMLTGGEPFLRRDLPEVVEAFSARSHPKVISITTSGWFPDRTEDVVGRILTSPTMRAQLVVNLSFDGTPEVHDAVRCRAGSYDRAMETARSLQGMAERYPRLAVGANLTLVPRNQDTILAAARLLARTRLFSFLSCNIYRENRPRHAQPGVDLDTYRELSRFVQAYSRRFAMAGSKVLGSLHRVKERSQANLIERTCRTNSYQGVPCEAGRNIGVIYSDGSVAPCELLPANWGSIKDRPFPEIWNEIHNRRGSDQIRRTKCFCTHECFVSASLNTQLPGVRDCLSGSRRPDTERVPC